MTKLNLLGTAKCLARLRTRPGAACSHLRKAGQRSAWLARDLIHDVDPCVTVTCTEVLELAWDAAIDKAKELGGRFEGAMQQP